MRVNSIFESISGEIGGFPQGTWATFIRLQGCNLVPGCTWCDTVKAQNVELGKMMETIEVVDQVYKYGNNHILITGGEPLFHTHLPELIEMLLEQRTWEVQVETNGSFLLPAIPEVHWVVDYKCPSSGVTDKMIPRMSFAYNLATMRDVQKTMKTERGSVYVKFVVADQADVDFALDSMIEMMEAGLWCTYAFSPLNADAVTIPHIAEQIKTVSKIAMRHVVFSVQLHKLVKLP